jgi:hypothetical protein
LTSAKLGTLPSPEAIGQFQVVASRGSRSAGKRNQLA